MVTNPSDQPVAADSESPPRIVVWGHYEIQYEVTQPDPSHWAAVGVVTPVLSSASSRALELVVGTGQTEAEAISDLRSRVMEQHPTPEMQDLFAMDSVSTSI